MGKCTNCLRGARLGITGVAPNNTLKMDMGGAVLYVAPKPDGKIDVVLNTENLFDGDYACAHWDGSGWQITTGDDRNAPKRK